MIPARFDAWRQGDFEALVVHWLRDRAKARAAQHAPAAQADAEVSS